MDNLSRGILYKVLATIFFTVMSAFVRMVAQDLPIVEVVFFRVFFAFTPLFIWAWWRGSFDKMTLSAHKSRHLTRSFNTFFGMSLGFWGLYYLPLADATAISYAAPLLTVPLAMILLKEKVRAYRWGATLIGFFGIVIILFPLMGATSEGKAVGALIMLIAAFSYALGYVIVRRLGTTESMEAIVFYFCLFNSLFAGVFMLIYGFKMPSNQHWLLLFLIGFTGGIGQMLIASASRHAEATLIAPFEYVSIIWATIIGFLAFSDIPSLYTYVGSVIVIAAGLFVFYRERKLGLKREST